VSKSPKYKIAKCHCKCPSQDTIYGYGLRLHNPRIIPKGLKFVGWTCTGCGTKVTEYI